MSSSQSYTGGTIPALFTWPVSNFSTLTEKEEKTYSADFAIGDRKWRVNIYLKVVCDQIPELKIYLLVTDSSKLPHGLSRDAKFELSVVDQVYNHCSIHKEVHHRFKEGNFNGGFSLNVPISDLDDPNRGFLLDDTLIVKAGVYLTKVPVIDTLDIGTPISAGGHVPVSSGTYATGLPANDTLICKTPVSAAQKDSISTWTIVNFSGLTMKHHSDIFVLGGYEWRMSLYPKGDDIQNLGIVLRVANSAKLSPGWSRDVEITFSVVDQVSSWHTVRKEARHKFNAKETHRDVSLMPLSELQDRSRGFLMNDTLVIEVRLRQEQEEKEHNKKESHIYTDIQLALNKDLLKPIPREIYFDLVDHHNVHGFHIQNSTSFCDFKEQVAEEFDVPVQYQQFWLWEKRQNHIYRPYRPLSPEEETLSVGKLRELSNKDNSVELKLFLDVEVGTDSFPIQQPQKTRDDILLFFKLYDPMKEELSYVGRIFVKSRSFLSEISTKLNKMAGLPLSQRVVLYKDIKFEPTFICEPFDKTLSFGANNQFVDGDIVYFQKSLSFGNEQHFLYPDVPSFLEFLHNRKVVHFRSLEKPEEDDFALELSKLDSYNGVVERAACVLEVNDTTRIRITTHDPGSQQPAPTSIDPKRKCYLSDMLVQTSDILYYQVLEPEAGPSTREAQPRAPTSSCVVCLDAPLEGACVPCGHMSGCMRCLNDIKAKNMGCPVCRAKIQFVLRIYSA